MSFETGKNLTGTDKISGKAPVSDKSGERTKTLVPVLLCLSKIPKKFMHRTFIICLYN